MTSDSHVEPFQKCWGKKITLDIHKSILLLLRPTRKKKADKGSWVGRIRGGEGSRVDAIFQVAVTNGSLRRSIFTSALTLLASLIPAGVEKKKEKKACRTMRSNNNCLPSPGEWGVRGGEDQAADLGQCVMLQRSWHSAVSAKHRPTPWNLLLRREK